MNTALRARVATLLVSHVTSLRLVTFVSLALLAVQFVTLPSAALPKPSQRPAVAPVAFSATQRPSRLGRSGRGLRA